MRRLRSGFLTIGHVLGAAVRLHWSLPLGLALYTRLHFVPGAWLGFVVIILVHELGHAFMAAGFGLHVLTVDAHGFGGVCRYEGYPTPKQRALVAWGGVIGQAALWLATLALVGAVGRPTSAFGLELVDALIWMNLYGIAFNLLPIQPLDGAEAWTILVILARSRALRREDAARKRARSETKAEIYQIDEPDDALPPMPDEVRRVLDRVMAQGREEQESSKKGK